MKSLQSTRKKWGFRLASVALALMPFVLFELSLYLLGAGEPSEASTPSIGFEAIHPLFLLSDDGHRFEIAKSRQAYFYPDSFSARKPERGFRVFCLGASTVQGRPYSIETSFTTWLELSLTAAMPERESEVVNCGGVSYASYRLVPILREVLQHEPDLVVIYTGHNEFLEATTFGGVNRSSVGSRTEALLSNIRTYNLLRSATTRSREAALLPAEVDALLDYRDGLADYHRDDRWRDNTIAAYEVNLREMIRLTREAGVAVVLLDPVSNLKDCPPFKAEATAALSAAETYELNDLWTEARQVEDLDQRIQLLEAALAIDDRHASAHFMLAHAYLARHRLEDARRHFVLAKDEDVCPLRMIEPLHAVLRWVATDTKTPLIDLRRVFSKRSESDIVGDELLLDHIHPSITGHQLIAESIVMHLRETNLVATTGAWEPARDELYRQQRETLDAVYYARGEERLEGLIRWTKGRASKLRDGAQ